MKYIIYSRVSTIDQDVVTQNQKCMALIAERGGTDILVISENDMSTSIKMENRPALQKMLGMLGKKITIVVYAIDRLARDNIELLIIRRMIKDKGSILLSCSENEDEFTRDIMGAVAKKEKERLIQRTIDKLKEKQRRLEKVGTTWYGYKLDETKLQLSNARGHSYKKPYLLIPHDEEQRNISLMLDLRKQGLGLMRICNRLTQMGYMNRAGKPFQMSSIYRIIRRAENNPCPPRKAYRKSLPQHTESLDMCHTL